MKTKLNFKQIITAGLMAGGVSAIINAILFYIFHTANVLVDTIQIQPNTPLTIVPILMSSIMPSLIGSIVFYFIEKYSSNGFKIFRNVSIVLVALSLISPFTNIPNVTFGYAMVLNVMHILVAVDLLYFIGKKVKATA
jgi:hypothetical protein